MSENSAAHRRVDIASSVTIIITFVLFGLALIEKGLTRDLLLEAGVFLVSFKLILASRKHDLATDELRSTLQRIEDRLPGPS